MDNKTYTVNEFVTAHRISRALFYKAVKEGWAPRMMHLGRRRVISAEAAAEWRTKMEAVK